MANKVSVASEGYAKVWLANSQTIGCALYGYISEANARTVLKQIKRQLNALARAKKRPIMLIIDVSGLTGQHRRVRDVAKEIGGLSIDKIAIFGAGRLLTRLAGFTLRYTRASGYVKMFRNEAQAKRWLRQSKNKAATLQSVQA